MIRKWRLHRLVYVAAFVIMAVSLTSCAPAWQSVYHVFLMKGSIIETYDSEVYLCIGSRDGAKVGQELDVYKIITVNKARSTFRRELTGKVKITEIVDEHFAKAKVISGKAEKNDIVELITP